MIGVGHVIRHEHGVCHLRPVVVVAYRAGLVCDRESLSHRQAKAETARHLGDRVEATRPVDRQSLRLP